MDLPIEEGTSEGKGENWSIYRDSLQHSLSHTTKPKPKPWERAPVSAHAPRLAGQRIWKKTSSLQSSTLQSSLKQDKENAVLAQLELETEGKGARKRRRGMGAKENIADAKWMLFEEENEVKGGGKPGVDAHYKVTVNLEDVSPKKIGTLRDEDAFLVPRKRTNANHMITPRKVLQSIPSNTVTPHAKVEKSQTSTSPEKETKIQLNDLEGVEQKDSEKTRRRKSHRKSRRLTKSDLVEEVVVERRRSFVFGQTRGDVAENFPGIDQVDAETEETFVETSVGAEEMGDSPEASSDLDQAATVVKVEEAAQALEPLPFQSSTEPMHTAEQQAAISETDEMTPPIEEPGFVKQAIEYEPETSPSKREASYSFDDKLAKHFGLDTIAELPTVEEEASQTVVESEDTIALPTEAVQPESSSEPQPSEPQPHTPVKATQLHPAIFESVEPSVATTLSPTKSIATPRSRRKTPQRSATRRSTRTTRNSSMSRGEILSQFAPLTLDGPAWELTDAASSSCNSRKQAVNSQLHVDNTESSSYDVELVIDHEDTVAETSADLPLVEEQSIENAVASEAVQPSETAEAPAEEPEEAALSTPKGIDRYSATAEDEIEEDSSEQDSCNEQLQHELLISSPTKPNPPSIFESVVDEPAQRSPASDAMSEDSAETLELIDPISLATSNSDNAPQCPIDESTGLQESSTPDPTTSELTETISENAPPAVYDHDDTDLLRNFLSKVKANKALKAESSIPKRKRSLPHSPLQIPLGTVEADELSTSPTSCGHKDDELDVSLPTASLGKRRKRNNPLSHKALVEEDNDTIELEPQSIRRSNRTRLPVKAAPAAPSFIPVRRLGGQDGENSTVTLRQNEEKELAALTRVNTRKNKKGASHPQEWLAKKEKSEGKEKEDPASKHKALKEVFDEKNYKQKPNRKGQTVVWAAELVEFQTDDAPSKKAIVPALVLPSAMSEQKAALVENEVEKEKEKPILPGDEKKSSIPSASGSASISASLPMPKVKVGIRSKMTLGMAANGTPAPKRRARGRP